MKITKIEPVVVGAPTPGTGQLSNKNYLFVRVHTDEGITGLGEASLGGYTNTVISLLGDLEELLIGEDPTRIEYLCQVRSHSITTPILGMRLTILPAICVLNIGSGSSLSLASPLA